MTETVSLTGVAWPCSFLTSVGHTRNPVKEVPAFSLLRGLHWTVLLAILVLLIWLFFKPSQRHHSLRGYFLGISDPSCRSPWVAETIFLEVEPFAETDEQFAQSSCVTGNHVLFAAGRHLALLCAPLVGAAAVELLASAAEPARG
jgi:hypothetical protein